ncbi:MAG: ATP-binding cassette domain-containing protein, partial [Alphaproteobacteria bacterium]|nr:ATP-binding cassette domain-containing protein [Alphaproteobacteria bacterium]
MIQLDGVHLNLQSAAGEVKVLRGINLRVERGERVGVGGPSGSGKSTMVMIIAGLERASSGTVFVDGADLNRMDEDALALFRRRRIGIV